LSRSTGDADAQRREHASLRPEGERGAGSGPSGNPDAAAAAAVEALRRGVRPEENARLLHDLYHPRLRAYFARRVRSPHDVADLTQETFIKIYSHIEAYRGDSRFSAWVFAIARNVLLRWRARRPPEETAGDGPSAGAEPAAAEPDPEALAGERERQALLRRAIALLPPRQRQCMVLRMVHRLRYEQIAAVMGISVNSVKPHLNQGRMRLQELLAEAAHEVSRLGDDPDAAGGGTA
jgi:RNA polymerase sigma-70 factor (ECF subfamily)